MRAKTLARGATFSAIACLIIGIGLFLVYGPQPVRRISPFDTLPAKTVGYRIELRNTTNRPVSPAVLFAHTPLEQTCAQRRVRIEASHPYTLITGPDGNQVLKFVFDTVGPYGAKIVSVRTTLRFSPKPVALSEKVPDRFALPKAGKDAHVEAIQRLAADLKAESVHATAANLHRWVADHMVFSGYLPRARGALRALSSRRGDCTEFADLFVALAQAVGIPARRVSGYLTGESRVLKAAGYHDWAEFYDNGVWRIADAQQRNFDGRYRDYVAVRIDGVPWPDGPGEDVKRFHVQGKGLKVKMDS